MLLRKGTVVTPRGSRVADVRVVDERIHDIGNLEPTPGEQVIDCEGCLIVPGGIDTHTHLQLEGMGTVTADDFASGTRSALAGGTTTVMDFATQFGDESLAEGLAHWHAKADGKAVSDYGFHMAMTTWRDEFADQMADMPAEGVTSFKLYMAYRGRMMVDDDQIYAALLAAKQIGATIGFHCENGYLIDALVNEQLDAGHTEARWHAPSRPDELEREAVNRLGVIAGLAGASVYPVHVSSASSLPEIRAAKQRGVAMAAETCPQYLVLDDSAYQGDESAARDVVMSPPLRSVNNQDGLWQGLADGDIQFVGTDHCSFTREQKAAADDFTAVPNGAPGLELRMSLLFSEGVAKHRLDAERFVAVTAENAARYFGIYPQKGVIAPGSDADIVVIDPQQRWTVHHDDLHDACDSTPYEGMELTGKVRDVLLRGHHVVRHGNLQTDLAPGHFIPCSTREDGIS